MDLQADFKLNIQPLKAAIAEGLQRLDAMVLTVRKEAVEHRAATVARDQAATSQKRLADAEKLLTDATLQSTQVTRQRIIEQSKERDLATQRAGLRREEARAVAQLNTLLKGQGEAAAATAARYSLLGEAELSVLQKTKANIAALQEEAKARKAAHSTGGGMPGAHGALPFGHHAELTGIAAPVVSGLAGPLLEGSAIGGAAAFAIEGAEKIERAMDKIRLATGATGPALKNLEESFRNVSAQVPQSFEAVAQAVGLVAQRTHLTGAALDAMAVTELNLSRITNTDLKENIRQATRAFQVWGVSVKDQIPALNQMFRASQVTGAHFDSLRDHVIKFSGALQLAGFSLQQSEALLGAFDHAGVETEKAVKGMEAGFKAWTKAGITDTSGALLKMLDDMKRAPTLAAAVGIGMKDHLGKNAIEVAKAARSAGFDWQKFMDVITNGKETIDKAARDTLHLGEQFDVLKKKVELAAEPIGRFLVEQLKGMGENIDQATPKLKALGKAFDDQATATKSAEARLVGWGAAIPLIMFGLGKASAGVTAFKATTAGLTTGIEKALEGVFAAFESTAAAAAALLAGLQIAAIVAVTGFIIAYETNYDHLWDRLKSGWSNLWEGVTSGAKEFFSGIQALGRETLPQVEDDFKAGIAKLGQYWDVGMKEIREKQASGLARVTGRETPVLPPVTAAGIQASGFAQHLGTGAATGVVTTTVTHGPRQGPAPDLEKLAEHARALKADHQASAVLDLMNQGMTKHMAELVARYGQANAAIMKHTAHTEELIAAREKLTKANEKADHLAKQLHAHMLATQQEIQRELAGKEPVKVARAGVLVEGADPKLEARATAAKREDDAMTARLTALRGGKAKAAAADLALEKQIDAEGARLADRALERAGATKQEASALDMLTAALKTQKPWIIAKAEAVFAAAGDDVAATEKATAHTKALALLTAAQKQVADRAIELAGSSKLTTAAEDALNAVLKVGTTAEIALARETYATSLAQDDQAKSARELKKLGDAITANYTRQSERLAELSGISHEVAVAQNQLNKALRSGSDEMVIMAAANLNMARTADAGKAAIKENAQEQRAFEKQLDRVRASMSGMFERGFADMMKGGFKNFFKTILGDLDSLLLQMAEKIAAAKLTELIMGKPGVTDAAGNSTGGGKGGLLGLLVNLIPSLLGGGGGGATGTVDANNVYHSFASQGKALGGSMFAGQSAWVGERGPEIWTPDRSGTITPHGQTPAGGGGMTVHQTFNISTPDVAGFKKSQSQLMADSLRMAQAHQLRNGS